MKLHIQLACTLSVIATTSFAQTFPVKSIVVSGPDTNRVNLVYLPDGFQAGTQLSTFEGIATGIQNYVFTITPFKEYRAFFNAYCIEVPSVDSGSSHPGTATDVAEPASPVVTANTYFGTVFDNANVHRAIVTKNNAAVYNVLNANLPMYDVPMVVANTAEYGGTGGPILTFTLAPSANEIAVHELGHTFGKLWDEYWNNMPGEHPNMTQESNPAQVKWKNWMNTGGVGIYAHGSTGVQATWYRPHQACKMRQLNLPFCHVCDEGIIDQVYKKINPVNSFSPATTVTTLPSVPSHTFSFSPIRPDPNTVIYTWMLNGNVLAVTDTFIQVGNSQLSLGNNTLTVTLTDTTNMSRSYTPGKGYAYSITWNIKNDWPNTITSVGGTAQYSYKLYPQPARGSVNLFFDNTGNEKKLEYEILSITGAVTKNGTLNINPGEQTIPLDISGLAAGTYLLNLHGDGMLVNSRFVVE